MLDTSPCDPTTGIAGALPNSRTPLSPEIPVGSANANGMPTEGSISSQDPARIGPSSQTTRPPNNGPGTRDYDFVIFGASGFTGQYVVREALLLDPKLQLRWAVAGRSKEKVSKAVEQWCSSLPNDASPRPDFLQVDIEDIATVVDMCRRTRLIINLVGPYRKYGEPVVKACVENATHLVDVCGEPEFLERMESQYHQAAKLAGCLIVESCGFDSIPSDLGCLIASRAYGTAGCPVKMDVFIAFVPGPQGFTTHYGTYESAVLGVGSQEELRNLRRSISSTKPTLRTTGPRPQLRQGPFVDPRMPGRSCFLFPGADSAVIRRTQESFSRDNPDYRAYHLACYVTVEQGFVNTAKLVTLGTVFQTLAKTSVGRSLLLKYPRFFTGGMFSHEGPTPEQIEEMSFTVSIFSEGVTDQENLSEGSLLDKSVNVVIKGPDPAYKGTSRMVLLSAVTILNEKDTLPTGGVFTPGYAFANARDFQDGLKNYGIEISVTEEALTVSTPVNGTAL